MAGKRPFDGPDATAHRLTEEPLRPSVAASPERRRELGANARAYAVRRVSRRTVLARYDALLRSMVS
ncbi:MAG: hypothetical protein GX465_08130 [Acidobacteria bacterium]|nr:hypothetical protein [Acidobacteriota bacterium]